MRFKQGRGPGSAAWRLGLFLNRGGQVLVRGSSRGPDRSAWGFQRTNREIGLPDLVTRLQSTRAGCSAARFCFGVFAAASAPKPTHRFARLHVPIRGLFQGAQITLRQAPQFPGQTPSAGLPVAHKRLPGNSAIRRLKERSNGLDGKIRTCDHLRPRQARYQAALRPDGKSCSSDSAGHERPEAEQASAPSHPQGSLGQDLTSAFSCSLVGLHFSLSGIARGCAFTPNDRQVCHGPTFHRISAIQGTVAPRSALCCGRLL